MGFLRTKKIKGNEYLYYVENKYKKGKIVQKSKKYYGRVFEFNIEKETHIDSQTFVDMNFNKAINTMIEIELENRGFKHNKGILEKDNIIVDIKKKRILNKGRDSVIKMNEGYLCNYNLKKLFKFEISENEDYKNIGLNLANLLADTGIKPNPEIFITIVQNMLN